MLELIFGLIILGIAIYIFFRVFHNVTVGILLILLVFLASYLILGSFPDWRKLGFEILALTFTKMDPKIISEELIGKVRTYAAKFSNAIFASSGEGLGMTGVIMSLHKDYRDYAKKLALFRSDWGNYMEDIQSFVMVTDEGVIKEFSFKYLDESLL